MSNNKFNPVYLIAFIVYVIFLMFVGLVISDTVNYMVMY